MSIEQLQIVLHVLIMPEKGELALGIHVLFILIVESIKLLFERGY